MSTVTTDTQIDYPESDGKPMGETDLHRNWMIRILQILEHRYANQRVYIAGDLLVYYEEGMPSRFLVPDCFVVLDHPPGLRRTFQTWQERRVPDVVFEVTSRGTSSVDIIDKPVIYEKMGVKEYFLYDPTAEYLEPPLQGYRMIDECLHEIPRHANRLHCETLGIDLFLRDLDLVIVDSQTGEEQLTKADLRDVEHSARLAAEARLREVEAELKQLKERNGN